MGEESEDREGNGRADRRGEVREGLEKKKKRKERGLAREEERGRMIREGKGR